MTPCSEPDCLLQAEVCYGLLQSDRSALLSSQPFRFTLDVGKSWETARLSSLWQGYAAGQVATHP